jgi:hypothetical protein
MDPVQSLAEAAAAAAVSTSSSTSSASTLVAAHEENGCNSTECVAATHDIASPTSPLNLASKTEETLIRHAMYSPTSPRQIHPDSPPPRKDTLSSISTQATTATMASAETSNTSYSADTSPSLHQSIFSVKDGSDVSNNRRASRRRTGPLSQQSRERAALIRKLGACHDCRRRRVAVSTPYLLFLFPRYQTCRDSCNVVVAYWLHCFSIPGPLSHGADFHSQYPWTNKLEIQVSSQSPQYDLGRFDAPVSQITQPQYARYRAFHGHRTSTKPCCITQHTSVKLCARNSRNGYRLVASGTSPAQSAPIE